MYVCRSYFFPLAVVSDSAEVSADPERARAGGPVAFKEEDVSELNLNNAKRALASLLNDPDPHAARVFLFLRRCSACIQVCHTGLPYR